MNASLSSPPKPPYVENRGWLGPCLCAHLFRCLVVYEYSPMRKERTLGRSQSLDSGSGSVPSSLGSLGQVSLLSGPQFTYLKMTDLGPALEGLPAVTCYDSDKKQHSRDMSMCLINCFLWPVLLTPRLTHPACFLGGSAVCRSKVWILETSSSDPLLTSCMAWVSFLASLSWFPYL